MSTANTKATTSGINYSVQLNASGHILIADEPEEHGGRNAGPNPYEYVLHALGACTSITLQMYASRKQWPLEQVEVELSLDKTGTHTDIKRTVKLSGPLSEEQRQRLLAIANACPVHKILTNPIHIDTILA